LPRRSSRGDTGKKIVFFVTEHSVSSLTLIQSKIGICEIYEIDTIRKTAGVST
jgi:hypothetical protein